MSFLAILIDYAGGVKVKPRLWLKKVERIVVHDPADERIGMAAAAHGVDEGGHGQRIGRSPIGRGTDQDAFRAVHFDHIDGAIGRGLGERIERDARPIAFVEREANGMLLAVIDAHAAAIDAGGRRAAGRESSACLCICLPSAACERASARRARGPVR